MYIADSHIHSEFSGDSKEKIKNIIEYSIKNNIDEITITDHIDPDFPGGSEEFKFDLDEYINTLVDFKEKYKNRIKLNIGVEFGMQPHLVKEYNEISRIEELDFIIVSTHVAEKTNIVTSDFFSDRSRDEAHRAYFEDTLKNVKYIDGFSVYGHIDFIKRYGRGVHEDFDIIDYNKHMDIIDEILKTIIEKGAGIEINTSAYRYGTHEPYPNSVILSRYKNLGGTIVTIGSDSHISEHIAMDFDKAFKLLKECGFDRYTVFNGREPKFIEIK